MIITIEKLRRLRTCEPQIEKFKRLFPNGMEVTDDNIEIAYRADMYITWILYRIANINALRLLQNSETYVNEVDNADEVERRFIEVLKTVCQMTVEWMETSKDLSSTQKAMLDM